VIRAATLSACGRYRYALERSFVEAPRRVLAWLMLNPSQADGSHDDPTIRRVIGFTQRAGFDAALVVNLFAWRATDPRDLRRELRAAGRSGVEGPRNRAAVVRAATRSHAVVCAWGAMPWAEAQSQRALGWLETLDVSPTMLCLGRTKDGSPCHPLMLAYDAHPLIRFERRATTSSRSAIALVG
jgi:hypothetical protein